MRATTFLVIASLVGFPGLVLAADLSEEMAPPLTQNWAGLYGGVHAGYGKANLGGREDTSSTTNPPEDFSDLDLNGFLGGLHLGYNFQEGNIVFGIEGDISFMNWDDSFVASQLECGGACAPDAQPDRISAEINNIASLRGRAGIAYDDVLIFGTVGAAWAHATAKFEDRDESGESGSVDFDDVGLVVGGGVEGKLGSDPWVWRVEGLYYHFDDSEDASNLTGDSDPGDSISLDDAWVVRAGISYRF